jgi:hypothetical protein
MFKPDLITVMKIFSILLINTLNAPDNTMIDSILLDTVNQGKKFSGKAELSIVSSEIIIDN